MRMDQLDVNRTFALLTAPLDREHTDRVEQLKRDAFRAEPRPIPEGLLSDGIPFGHIAFMGDFDSPSL